VAANRNTRFRAKNRLLEFQRDIFSQIGTALGTTASTRTAAEKVSETEKISEDFADILKNRRVKSARSSTAHGSMPEAVVSGTFVRIRQDGIGFAALFEPLFCIRVIGIAIRMKLKRQLAVGALDLLLAGPAGNPEDFVVIAFYVAGQNRVFAFRRM